MTLTGRRTQLYCVGTGKSGTHSIAAMFENQLRVQHEAQRELLIRNFLEFSAGRMSAEDLAAWIRERDRELNLEVDSSQMNYFILDVLVREFAGARFVLTIRDCYSWLDSFLNHSVGLPVTPDWVRMRDFRFKPERYVHSPQESALNRPGVYTLNGYFSYWAEHNSRVIRIVPPERLLVVRTDQISRMAPHIAEFAGLPASFVEAARTHEFKVQRRANLLEQVDRDYLESKVEQHCRPLMARYFPEVASFDHRPAGA